MKRVDFVEAMRRAFAAGSDYWRLADSENYRDHAKADQVKAKFESMVKELAAQHTED